MVYVGLDVSLNSVAICVIDSDGKVVREGTTIADPPSIAHFLGPWSGAVERVRLEAGPTSEWLTANLLKLASLTGMTPAESPKSQGRVGSSLSTSRASTVSRRAPWPPPASISFALSRQLNK